MSVKSFPRRCPFSSEDRNLQLHQDGLAWGKILTTYCSGDSHMTEIGSNPLVEIRQINKSHLKVTRWNVVVSTFPLTFVFKSLLSKKTHPGFSDGFHCRVTQFLNSVDASHLAPDSTSLVAMASYKQQIPSSTCQDLDSANSISSSNTKFKLIKELTSRQEQNPGLCSCDLRMSSASLRAGSLAFCDTAPLKQCTNSPMSSRPRAGKGWSIASCQAMLHSHINPLNKFEKQTKSISKKGD